MLANGHIGHFFCNQKGELLPSALKNHSMLFRDGFFQNFPGLGSILTEQLTHCIDNLPLKGVGPAPKTRP